ncbi:hypothetical protein LH704_11740 [Burkholderia cenocepacia]|uniref:hypothetical protein n=1 Tax=Burkholderia cenocepacia TaxID=95486 RepID=UPI001F2DAD2A|nr:hypothetical protein [Burkholderia cenocepacia]MCF1367328.1 hypothetical protein [Burkholderia cenocepacia]MCF1384861.1 hypothetical protein [Burkholderia cenocepacia]
MAKDQRSNNMQMPIWRLRVVHLVAKAVGIQFKFETLPFGAQCHFRASAEGVDYLRRLS